jgi:hypothetical protein
MINLSQFSHCTNAPKLVPRSLFQDAQDPYAGDGIEEVEALIEGSIPWLGTSWQILFNKLTVSLLQQKNSLSEESALLISMPDN